MSRLKHSYSHFPIISVGLLCLCIGVLTVFLWPRILSFSTTTRKDIVTDLPTSNMNTSKNTPVTRSIRLVIFDPILESKGGSRLRTYKKYDDPSDLTKQAIKELHDLSGGYVTYTIADTQTYDSYVRFPDGFMYDDTSYLACLDDPKTCHTDYVDYHWLVSTFDLCNLTADEVWLWGGPYFNFDTFRPIKECAKKFYAMGFNYERDLPIMLFAIGGRMDSVLRYRIAGDFSHANGFVPFNPTGNDAWTRFVRACGTSYAPPNTNTLNDYAIFDSKQSMKSNCNAWINFPNISTATDETMTCDAWDCSNSGFQRFWFSRIPRNPGYTNDTNGKIYNNWWKYYINLKE